MVSPAPKILNQVGVQTTGHFFCDIHSPFLNDLNYNIIIPNVINPKRPKEKAFEQIVEDLK